MSAIGAVAQQTAMASAPALAINVNNSASLPQNGTQSLEATAALQQQQQATVNEAAKMTGVGTKVDTVA